MKNVLILKHEAEDIQSQVKKIVKGLGNPEPPLSLDDVRELLNLDRRYYSSGNQGAVNEFVSKVKIAGKQIVMRPSLLWDVIKKAKISALWIPDKKRILIDESKPKLKHRWSEAHEVGHAIIPWHQQLLLGDNEFSLNPGCHETLEAEANYAAGQLLFLMQRFVDEAMEVQPSLSSVKKLKERFGNTFTSTLWRYVEETGTSVPLVGIVSGNPHFPGSDFDPEQPCKHCIHSPAFRQKFSTVTEVRLFEIIGSYCRHRTGGPLGEGTAILSDDNGNEQEFLFESFSNTYEVLTLGRRLQSRRVSVSV